MLFLSYFPESDTFEEDTANQKHSAILKNPYAWMQQNSEKVVELNARNSDQYDKVVLDRLIKMEKQLSLDE